MIRQATLQDLDSLVTLENRCFTGDRLSRRSFRHMLTKAHASMLVVESNGAIPGYVIVLFHAGTSLARMYSLAVDPDAQGAGLGRRLMEAAEDAARDNDCVYMRLEVRHDNRAAIRLYEGMGYRRFGSYDAYYEDHAEALRFEKRLVSSLPPDMVRVPYYEQTLDFTCGPAALLMAMKALDEVERKYAPPSDIYHVIERYTSCAVGICGKCATPDGRRACIDGPVFSAEEFTPGLYTRDVTSKKRYYS